MRQPGGGNVGTDAWQCARRVARVANAVAVLVGHVGHRLEQVRVDHPGDTLVGAGGEQAAEPAGRRQVGDQLVVDEHAVRVAPRDVDEGQQPRHLHRCVRGVRPR